MASPHVAPGVTTDSTARLPAVLGLDADALAGSPESRQWCDRNSARWRLAQVHGVSWRSASLDWAVVLC
jgi:hypothetical protein